MTPHIHTHSFEANNQDVMISDRLDFEGIALEDGTRQLLAVFRPSIGHPYACRVVVEHQSPESVLAGLKATTEALLGYGIGPTDCPGCGRRVYGFVARRGMCFECLPEPEEEPDGAAVPQEDDGRSDPLHG